MIKTKKFSLTNHDYFKIIITIYFKRRWWIISLMLFIGLLFLLKKDKDSLEYFLIFLGFIYPILILIQFWRFAISKENKIFLAERFFEISKDSLTGKLNDGSEDVIKKENFIRTLELKKYYLLYISKSQFIFIPKEVFMDQKDKDWFIREYIKQIRE